jgi:hypothetical protein
MSGAITLFVGSVQAVINCPSCQTVTSKVHSRYERGTADLPRAFGGVVGIMV